MTEHGCSSRSHDLSKAEVDPDTLERLTGTDRPAENDIEAYALVLSGPGTLNSGQHAKRLTKATAKAEGRLPLHGF